MFLFALQFKRAYKRNDKPICIAAITLVAHLTNQQVANLIRANVCIASNGPLSLLPSQQCANGGWEARAGAYRLSLLLLLLAALPAKAPPF
jgi:hypothetical protein